MIHLPDRLHTIADCVERNETVADIGTDHGLLPIFLWQQGISTKMILSDVNEGPLKKAEENINLYAKDMIADLRLGDGLNVLDCHEVNTVILAGMGGLLMTKILKENLEKSRTFSKYILQPRNAQDRVRRWLLENEFSINDEFLVVEGDYVCEVIVTTPNPVHSLPLRKSEWVEQFDNNLEYEVSPLLFDKNDPLLEEFLQRKLRREGKIALEILTHGSDASMKKAKLAHYRINILKRLLQKLHNNNETR